MKPFIKCILFIFLIGIVPAYSHAATIYNIGMVEGECFADSKKLSLPCTISQNCDSSHNVHYYYVEVSEAASYTFSASTGTVVVYNSFGKTVSTKKLSPDRYYLKLSTGNYKGTVTLLASKSSQNTQGHIPVKKITLKKSKKTIYVGKKYVIKPMLKPASATNKKLCFRSSKKKIASVSSKGMVKGKKTGKTTITISSAENKKIKAKCKITVYPAKKKNSKKVTGNTTKPTAVYSNTATQAAPSQSSSKTATSLNTKKTIPVSRIRLSSSLVTLQKGKHTTLQAAILPTNATNKNILWRSMNSSIASVSNGRILAKKRGITTIIATSEDNPSCCSSCTVSVR